MTRTSRIPWAAVVALFLVGSPFARAADVPPDTPEALIRSLYQHHRPAREVAVDTCRRNEISRYCDPGLVDLFLKDCACAKKTHEVCNLDWDPFYDAQDFGDEDPNPRIRRVGDSNAFEVTITNLGETHLVYDLSRTKSGWRISNIRTSKWNLREALSGKR